MRTLIQLSALLAFLTLPATAGSLAPAAPSHARLSQDDHKKSDDKKTEDEKKEEPDRHVAIVGGDVYTGTGAVLRGATIHGKNGKIVEIGYDLWLPEETELIDARGMSVYPGLVALSATNRISHGLFAAESEMSAEADSANHDAHFGIPDEGNSASLTGSKSPPADSLQALDAPALSSPLSNTADSGLSHHEQAARKAEDGYDPYSEFLVLALAAGITTADQSGVATKLRRDTFKGTYMNDGTFARMSWSVQSPQSITSTKKKFAKAAEYLRAYRTWQGRSNKEEKEPSKSGVDSSTLSVLKGEVFARFTADSREALLGIARLAQRYNFRPVIWGCREGWTVADELGRAGAFAVVNPRVRRTKAENLVRPGGSSIENAAKLNAAGVQVAIITANSSFDMSGLTGRDLSNLPLEADFAIRGGLPGAAAFAAITSVPARLLGVDWRVGTLEAGKDLDALICDGDIMHYDTFVQVAMVDGKVAYEKSKEIFYAHIRPRPELPALDPGEFLEGGQGAAESTTSKAAEEEKTDEAGKSSKEGSQEEKSGDKD